MEKNPPKTTLKIDSNPQKLENFTYLISGLNNSRYKYIFID